jgi:hypothetical protein
MAAPHDLHPPKIYLCYIDHEHDRTYAENVIAYFESAGVLWRPITLNTGGLRPELEQCIDDEATTAVLGFNSDLDHSWLKSGSFLDAAERHGIPVLQWILDHPSGRWAEFHTSTTSNSRFLMHSEQECQYFETYCLPGALTAAMGGVGADRRSRIGALTRQSFARRPLACMIPLNLHRLLSIEKIDESLRVLERPLDVVAREAIASARCDLTGSLESHVIDALAACKQSVTAETFHWLCHLVENSVQVFRRLQIFATARRYPVLIQSDESAAPFVEGAVAKLATNVGMPFTHARMPMCRAVLSVSPINDMIHDRTMNAFNAGCVAIAEDNFASKKLLRHKINALLFRYDDGSLDECLDIVCSQPGRAYEIAQAGMKLRDDPRVGTGRFGNIIDLANRPLGYGKARRSAGLVRRQ